MLNEIQCRLFDLGAAVATPPQSSQEKLRYTKFSPHATLKLEEWIDRLDAQLPPLTNFVIPVRRYPCCSSSCIWFGLYPHRAGSCMCRLCAGPTLCVGLQNLFHSVFATTVV
jgi:hypothetical protein